MPDDLYILGDPHLGRAFIHGVPLHRRGEREAMVWKQFEAALLEPDVTFHVCLGDLFDKPVMSYDTIMRAASVYLRAAGKNPKCNYVVLKGNHDWFRDLTRASAFDLFTELVKPAANITVVSDRPRRMRNLGFVGYSVEHPAENLVNDYLKGCHTVFGHWDVTGQTSNLIPTRKMAKLGIGKAITGHVHKPDTFTRDNVEVTVHGSMQPYAHGEETNDDLYVTIAAEDIPDLDPDFLRTRCVRTLGVPEDVIDCLQLTVKHVGEDEAEAPQMAFGGFDLEEIFQQAFREAGLSQEMQDKLMADYQARRLSAEP